MSSHIHDDNEEAYYVTSDAKDDSLYDKLTQNGSYQRPELEDIVAYLVSLDGVEQRGAYVEKSGSRKSGKKIKKEKIAYFKGSRVGNCFPDVSGLFAGIFQRLVRSVDGQVLAKLSDGQVFN